jgi:hypothetical protein
MKAFKYAILTFMVAPAIVGCDDDDTYIVGPVVAEDCPNVYFTEGNSNYAMYTPIDVPSTINIEMKRGNTNGTLTVPVTATLNKALTAPASVTFNDGEATAYYPISISGSLESGVDYTYSLSVPDEYIDFYTTKDGAGRFDGKFVIASEVSFSVYVQDQASGYKNLFPAFSQKAYEVTKTNYVIPDFLGSGHAVTVGKDSAGKLSLTGESDYSYDYSSSSCIWLNGPMYCGTNPGENDTFLYGMYVYYGSYSGWSYDSSWWTDNPGFYLNCQFYYTTPTLWQSDSYNGYDWGYIYFYLNN